MSSRKVESLKILAVILFGGTCLFFWPLTLPASDDYSFDLDEFERKRFEWGGYLELKGEHLDFNEQGAFFLLNNFRNRRSDLDRFTTTLQLEGNLNKGIIDFNFRLQASASQDQLNWDDNADVFEAYASIKPTPLMTVELGKKTFKWGKGYAWNPAGFIDRPKDPNDPEDALEGFVGAGIDLIKSFSGSLQNVALTTVLLPVFQGINEDFGEPDNVNIAAKLYLLYKDTDIDFIWYTGNSRSTRYGIDFSKNLATNFEIHVEAAHVPRQRVKFLTEEGTIFSRETSDFSYLLGLRYLTENDITAIVEFYHNDDGFSEQEMSSFYDLTGAAAVEFDTTGNDSLFQRAQRASQAGYGKPQPGRNYLYTRITQKEPFDILYFTPGLTAIVNLDDQSYSVSPEVSYTGITNWEVRFRFSLINGGTATEYGEKINSSKIECRLRYFF